jgi:NTE family protein
VLDEGPLALALRATTSVPGVFMPVEMNGQRLVDGGVLNNLPVDVVRKMGAKVVIAVDIGLARMGGVGYWIGNRRWVPGGIATTLEVIDDTIFALRVAEQANKLQQFPPGVLISPELPKSVNTFTGYDRVAELVATGERAAEEHLDEIRALIYPPRHWWFFRKQVEVDHHLAQ